MKKLIILLISITLVGCSTTSKASSIKSKVISEDFSQVTIGMVGDILMHDRLLEYCYNDDSYDFSGLFSQTADQINSYDLSLCNQETIVGGEQLGVSGYPQFNAPNELATAVVDAGFDVICQANNHALDRGTIGLNNDVATFEGLGVNVVGIYDEQEDNHVLYKHVKNINLSIVNFTFSTNGIEPEYDYQVDYIELNHMKELVSIAKQNSDYVVVVIHWGTEYEFVPDSNQEYVANYLNELEVDLILGSHPHVIQPVTIIGEDYQTLVYYSLGNFINASASDADNIADRMLGGIAEVVIKKDDTGCKTISYDFVPVVSHVDLDGYTATYFLEDYSEELASRSDILDQDKEYSFKYLNDLYEKIIEIDGE